MNGTNNEVTAEQAQAALEVLKAFGRQRFEPEFRAEQPDATCIGGAIAKLADYDTDLCLDTAGALCEEVNYHDEAFVCREGIPAYREKYPDSKGT